MKITQFILGLTGILVTGFCLPISASEPSEVAASQPQVVIKTSVPEKTLRRYDVVTNIKGDSSATISMTLQHKYLQRTREGILPMEASLDGGALCSGDQKLALGSGNYPRLTVLLDRDFRTQNVLGAARLQSQRRMPGINYGNMIILFYLPDGDKGHAIGDTWESKVALPNERETYRISSTLKAVETLDGANAAVIEQIISREDDSEPKISVESRFAVDDGRLLKSRVSYTIPDSSGTDGSGSEAAVVTDIQLAK